MRKKIEIRKCDEMKKTVKKKMKVNLKVEIKKCINL
jgi:hypothetical protein